MRSGGKLHGAHAYGREPRYTRWQVPSLTGHGYFLAFHTPDLRPG